MLKGIDISYHQGNIDFKKVKNSKEVDFIVLRQGYRKAIDAKFIEYVKECKNNNIPIMVYHFIYTNGATIQENAQATFDNIKKADLNPIDTWIAVDLEYDTWKKNKEVCTREKCTAYTKQYLDVLKSLGCKKLFIYTNTDYYKNYYDWSQLSEYPIWLADYAGAPDYPCAMQQYTSTGKINGINGYVDMNYLFDETMLNNTIAKPQPAVIVDNKNDNTVTADDALNIFRSWIGLSRSEGTHKVIIDTYNNYTPRARGYKVTYKDAYCDTTISAIFIKLNAVDLIGGTECGVENHIALFKKAGIWEEDGTIVPEKGYLITYNWDDTTQPNDGYADHIGMVESVSGNNITVLEGNMNGGKVGRRTVPVGWGYIRGYAKPKYGTKQQQKETSTVGNIPTTINPPAVPSTIKVDYAQSFNKNIAKTYITTANLRLRSGASLSKPIITVMPEGSKVTCYGYYTGDWYYVVYGKYTGFCSKKYLR